MAWDAARHGRRPARACCEVDRALTATGVAAPLVAFVFSFTILFREGVEAVLLVAILLGSLKAGRADELHSRPLRVASSRDPGVDRYGGVLCLCLLAAFVIEVAPLQRGLLEGMKAFVAVVVLFTITFWLVARLEHRHWMEFMRARVSSAIAAGTALAFAGLSLGRSTRGSRPRSSTRRSRSFAEGLVVWIARGAFTAGSGSRRWGGRS